MINQAQVALDVRLSFFSRDFYNALQNKDQAEFWRQLGFVFLPFTYDPDRGFVVEYVVTSTFVIRWRRWLSAHYIGRWLGEGAHYPMALAARPPTIPTSAFRRTSSASSMAAAPAPASMAIPSRSLQTLTSLVSYTIVLWGLSSNFTLPGSNLIIPGLLFWVALIYAGIGTAIAHLIGRPLIGSISRSSNMRPTSASDWRACANTASRSRCCAAKADEVRRRGPNSRTSTTITCASSRSEDA